ncbi:phosphate acetyltransferase [Candidatus Dependentiae bacterium]|nr:phosphate acetyltransferase [Candidatus Dependentiae bacterium]
MNFSEMIIDKINKKIKSTGSKKKLVLPESSDVRTLNAISVLSKKDWLEGVITVGDKSQIERLVRENNIDFSKVEMIDINSDPLTEKYINKYYEMRKDKGISIDDAKNIITNNLFYGAMLLKENKVQGMVAGALNTTADVLRSAIQIVKTCPGIKKVSSCFAMIVPECSLGAEGRFIFADCAVLPDPDSETLADIAGSSAKTFELIFETKPVISFLSFSTKGSAEHALVDKVKNAVNIAKQKFPGLEIDGEMQLDAAIVPSVGSKKAPGSSVAGRANVLIFPDLNSGNIGYKLVQRLAKAEAYGPIIQGLAKPVSDLSRGCSVEDIVNVGAITALESYL